MKVDFFKSQIKEINFSKIPRSTHEIANSLAKSGYKGLMNYFGFYVMALLTPNFYACFNRVLDVCCYFYFLVFMVVSIGFVQVIFLCLHQLSIMQAAFILILKGLGTLLV